MVQEYRKFGLFVSAVRLLGVTALAGSGAMAGCVGGGGGAGGYVAQPYDAAGTDGTSSGGTSSGGTSSGGTSSGGVVDGGGTSGGDDASHSTSGGTSSGASSGGGLDAGPIDITVPKCGDGECVTPETSETCPQDCAASGPKCGDFSCDGLETSSLCAVDCLEEAKGMLSCAASKCASQVQACQAKSACISAVNEGLLCMKACGAIDTKCSAQCAASFNKDNVSAILASCALSNSCVASPSGPKCGDGKCEGNETSNSCPQDCKSGPVCGNGSCESGETSSSCPADCKTTTTSGCGDEQCSGAENASSCPIDCQQGAKAAWSCMAQKCSSEKR